MELQVQREGMGPRPSPSCPSLPFLLCIRKAAPALPSAETATVTSYCTGYKREQCLCMRASYNLVDYFLTSKKPTKQTKTPTCSIYNISVEYNDTDKDLCSIFTHETLLKSWRLCYTDMTEVRIQPALSFPFAIGLTSLCHCWSRKVQLKRIYLAIQPLSSSYFGSSCVHRVLTKISFLIFF